MTIEQLGELDPLVASIRQMRTILEELIPKMRDRVSRIEKGPATGGLRASGILWKNEACLDAIIKARIFTEQNFHYIETMCLLAVTRYLFEVMVWLKRMECDERF